MTAVARVMQTLTERVREDLPTISQMSRAEIAAVLLAYEKIIARNFIPWMAITYVLCRSVEARRACRDNLLCEIDEEHPTMLLEFVAPLYSGDFDYSIRAASLAEVALTKEKVIDTISGWCHTQAFAGLCIMAVLENTSLAFIPWMEQAADRLGLARDPYLLKHGIRDVAHAEEFCRAIDAELFSSDAITEEWYLQDQLVNQVLRLISVIFHAHELDPHLAQLD